MLACAREIRTVVRQPRPVYLFSQTDVPIGHPDTSGREMLDAIPANPRAVFDEAIAASSDNPFTQSRADVQFVDKIAVGQCDGSAGCQRASIQGYFNTVAEAKKFLDANPESVVISGVYSDEIISVFRTAASPQTYYYHDSQSLAKAQATGRVQRTHLTGVENMVRVLAHEAGHHFGLGHGDDMSLREKGAIRYHRRRRE
jgi:hypothetical protein